MDKLIEQAIKNCKINKYEKYFEQVCEEYKRLLDEESKQLNLPHVSKCDGLQGRELLLAYFDWHKQMGFVSHKTEDIDEFLSQQ